MPSIIISLAIGRVKRLLLRSFQKRRWDFKMSDTEIVTKSLYVSKMQIMIYKKRPKAYFALDFAFV